MGERMDLHYAGFEDHSTVNDGAHSFVPVRWPDPCRAPFTYPIPLACAAYAATGVCAEFDSGECARMHVRRKPSARRDGVVYYILERTVDANTGAVSVHTGYPAYHLPPAAANWTEAQRLELVCQQTRRLIARGWRPCTQGAVNPKRGARRLRSRRGREQGNDGARKRSRGRR